MSKVINKVYISADKNTTVEIPTVDYIESKIAGGDQNGTVAINRITGITDFAANLAKNGTHAAKVRQMVGCPMAGTPVDLPVLSNTSFVYNGETKEPTLPAYQSGLVTVSGTTSAKNAGTYSITYSLADDITYEWADHTISDKVVTWTIARKPISTVPTQNGTLTYSGSVQSPTWNDYNTSELVLGGTTSGTDASEYSATFTPKSNFKWSDETIDPKIVTWSIGKAAGGVTLSADYVSLDKNNLTDTVNVSVLGNGTVTVSSSDDSVATVSYANNVLTVESVATGSATVTVSIAEGTNHLAASTTLPVTVVLAPIINGTLNNNTWEAISYVAQEGTGDTYWDIGDVKMITLNGKIGQNFNASNLSIGVFILAFNHKDNGVSDNNIIFGGFKTAVTSGTNVALVDFNNNDKEGPSATNGTKMFNMNHWGNSSYGGWKGCDFRYDVLGATNTAPSDYGKAHTASCVGYDATESTITNPVANTFLSALPSDLRSVIRLRTHYVDNKGEGSNSDVNVTSVTDAVFLLAEYEIFGYRHYANQYEQSHQTQMAYYKNGNSTQKFKHTNYGYVYWFEASPCYYSGHSFCYVYHDGGINYGSAYLSLGLAPAFKV